MFWYHWILGVLVLTASIFLRFITAMSILQTVKAEKNGGTVSIFLDKLYDGTNIVLRNVNKMSSVKGADVTASDLGIVLKATDTKIVVEL
jgi:hypothetical protein